MVIQIHMAFSSVSQTNSMYTKQVQYNCFDYNIFFYALKTIVVFSLMNEWVKVVLIS